MSHFIIQKKQHQTQWVSGFSHSIANLSMGICSYCGAMPIDKKITLLLKQYLF
jgi:hypothetical protein